MSAMTDEQLRTALEHDIARREGHRPEVRPILLAAECFRNAAVASRGAEAALMVCDPPALREARQAARLAILSLEQAMALMGMEQQADE